MQPRFRALQAHLVADGGSVGLFSENHQVVGVAVHRERHEMSGHDYISPHSVTHARTKDISTGASCSPVATKSSSIPQFVANRVHGLFDGLVGQPRRGDRASRRSRTTGAVLSEPRTITTSLASTLLAHSRGPRRRQRKSYRSLGAILLKVVRAATGGRSTWVRISPGRRTVCFRPSFR